MLPMRPNIIVIGKISEEHETALSLIGETKMFPAIGVVKHRVTRPDLGLPDLQVLNSTLRDANLFVYSLSADLNKDAENIINVTRSVAPLLVLRDSDDEETFGLLRAGVDLILPTNSSSSLLLAYSKTLLGRWQWAETIAIKREFDKMNK